MARTELQNRIVAELQNRKMTTADLAAAFGESEEVLKDAILMLSADGTLQQDADFYYVAEEVGVVETDLSEFEWEIIHLLWSRKGEVIYPDQVAVSLGKEKAIAALERLVKVGIVEKMGSGYRITSATELNIPLSAQEQKELQDAEAVIDRLDDEIEDRQLLVADQLRFIRDRKLYRETHKRFGDYVAERFERTRDWAYKKITHLEVIEGLGGEKPTPEVEALLQTVTAREIPHLARLKKEPAKMQKALREADKKARKGKRLRTPEDVKEAVESLKEKPKKKDSAPKPPRIVRKVTFTGIDHPVVETENLPGSLRQFADWFKKNPTDSAFTIKVSKAKKVSGN